MKKINLVVLLIVSLFSFSACETKAQKAERIRQNDLLYDDAYNLLKEGKYDRAEKALDKVDTSLRNVDELREDIEEHIRQKKEYDAKFEKARKNYYDIVTDIKNGNTKDINEDELELLFVNNYKEIYKYYHLYGYMESVRSSGYPGINRQLHVNEKNEFIGAGRLFSSGLDMYNTLLSLELDDYIDKDYFIECRLEGKWRVFSLDISLQMIDEESIIFNSLRDNNLYYYDESRRGNADMLFKGNMIVYKEGNDYIPVFKIDLSNDKKHDNILTVYDEKGTEYSKFYFYDMV